MRRSVIGTLSLVLFLASCSAEEQPKQLEPKVVGFEFRKLIPASTTIDAAQKAGTVRDCETDGHGVFTCRWTKTAVGDVPVNQSGSFVVFEGGKFDYFSFNFFTGDYDRMRKLMTSLYGAPCTDEQKPSMKFGPNAFRHDVRWCFKEGELMLTEESSLPRDLRSGSLEFFQFAPDKPEKVFDRSSI